MGHDVVSVSVVSDVRSDERGRPVPTIRFATTIQVSRATPRFRHDGVARGDCIEVVEVPVAIARDDRVPRLARERASRSRDRDRALSSSAPSRTISSRSMPGMTSRATGAPSSIAALPRRLRSPNAPGDGRLGLGAVPGVPRVLRVERAHHVPPAEKESMSPPAA